MKCRQKLEEFDNRLKSAGREIEEHADAAAWLALPLLWPAHAFCVLGMAAIDVMEKES
jgi:hypothetical protein